MIRDVRVTAAIFCTLLGLLGTLGCSGAAMFYQSPPPPEMLGTKVDQIMQLQQDNADAAKFVVYQHEFEDQRFENGEYGEYVKDLRLNEAGEDHVRKIAEQLRAGAPYPVVVERSNTSPKNGTQFKYPLHYAPDLDMKRRELIVQALTRMGIADAEARVVVAPAFSQGLTGMEAESAYHTGMWGGGGWGGGMGGGMGGWGGGWQ